MDPIGYAAQNTIPEVVDPNVFIEQASWLGWLETSVLGALYKLLYARVPLRV
jgi:hypothetical protein